MNFCQVAQICCLEGACHASEQPCASSSAISAAAPGRCLEYTQRCPREGHAERSVVEQIAPEKELGSKSSHVAVMQLRQFVVMLLLLSAI